MRLRRQRVELDGVRIFPTDAADGEKLMSKTFSWENTTDDIVEGLDLSGKTIVITGASSGLGAETARALASRGARIIAANRPGDKSDGALATLREQVPGVDVQQVDLDLASLDSVRTCATRLREVAPEIDVLINNAGVMATPQAATADGFEQQFGINHLGHFLLTRELIDQIRAGGGGRVVNLSSAAHWRGGVDLDDPNFENREYEKWAAYGQSKTANALHARELASRYGNDGITAFSVHPGVIPTDLARYLTEQDLLDLIARTGGGDEPEPDSAGEPATTEHRIPPKKQIPPRNDATRPKSIPQGAATTVWAAVTPGIEQLSGAYCEDCGPAEPRPEEGGSHGYAEWAIDPAAASALWELSEALVGP